MEIKTTGPGPIRAPDTTRQRAESIATNARFMDVLSMMQSDGVIAQNPEDPVEQLSAEQKEQLRDSYDITQIEGMGGRRAVLNELVGLGALSAEESELSMMQLLPPGGGAQLGSGWEAGAGFEEMLEDPNYLSHLQRAIEFDGLWGRSQDVMQAREKVYEVLKDIFG
ncbi:hypothetical protein LJC49_05200 [Ruminococcaceae bacterium OttesenSCG-928-I18]|nr:hypothetical protein [Ruminococcaceae bacterium OttesenSCG-928-I18]